MNTPQFWQDKMAHITESLTRARPVNFVRRLQLIFVLVTLTMVTYYLAEPYLGLEVIDISEDGVYSIGKVAPETIVSKREIIYDDIEKTNLEKAKAYKSGFPVFERDFTILTNVIKNYIDEDFDNLKLISSESGGNKNFNLLIAKNVRWKFRSKEDLTFLLNYPRKEKLREQVVQTVNLVFSSCCILKEILSPYLKDISE